ncbi:hypothetical protein JOM56_012366 [Amanita muscaria]
MATLAPSIHHASYIVSNDNKTDRVTPTPTLTPTIATRRTSTNSGLQSPPLSLLDAFKYSFQCAGPLAASTNGGGVGCGGRNTRCGRRFAAVDPTKRRVITTRFSCVHNTVSANATTPPMLPRLATMMAALAKSPSSLTYYTYLGVWIASLRRSTTGSPQRRCLPASPDKKEAMFSHYSSVPSPRRTPALLQEGYEKYRGFIFKVSTWSKWLILVSGPQMIEDLRTASDDELVERQSRDRVT